jgi:GNAT superfamily N-acetyltransferase
MVDSPRLLEAFAPEIPKTFRDSVEELRRRVAQGCVLSLARRARLDGTGWDVIGYELAERGIFSALERRTPVAADVIFSHWSEVLPAFRGQRVHGLLFATRDAYFRARGGRVVVGVCAPWNRASLKALHRDGAVIAGAVERIDLLRGRLTWETPWARIEAALRGEAPPSRIAKAFSIARPIIGPCRSG